MTTPIFDFVKKYSESKTARFHMPGHKGVGELGLEAYDITEISGADVLYSANGIIEESEVLKNWYIANGFVHTGTKKFDHLPFTSGYLEWEA